MGTLDKATAIAKARAAKSRWLLVVFFGAVFWVGPLTSLGQNSAVPVLGPLPLEQTNGQAGRFEFEVASVRLNEKWKFADPGYSLDSDDNYVPGESLFIADGPLSTFIGFAYKLDLLNSMIANLPKWANDQSYEIRARVPGAPSKDQVRLMMRALLIERFQLAIHFEKQEKPALALTLIKPGKLGPGLHRHDEGAGCKVTGTPPKPENRFRGSTGFRAIRTLRSTARVGRSFRGTQYDDATVVRVSFECRRVWTDRYRREWDRRSNRFRDGVHATRTRRGGTGGFGGRDL